MNSPRYSHIVGAALYTLRLTLCREVVLAPSEVKKVLAGSLILVFGRVFHSGVIVFSQRARGSTAYVDTLGIYLILIERVPLLLVCVCLVVREKVRLE